MHIPEMIEDSIFITGRKSKEGRNSFDTFRYYVAEIQLDGKEYVAKIVVGRKRELDWTDRDNKSRRPIKLP